jgi:hypothetical protein
VRNLLLGRVYGCILRFDGSVACWLNETDGQPQPGALREIAGMPAAVELGVGHDSGCARSANDEIFCFSAPRDMSDRRQVSDVVARIEDPAARRLVVGGYRACAALHDSTLACWSTIDPGLRHGFRPAALAHGIAAVNDAAVAREYGAICALTADAATCWRTDGDGPRQRFDREQPLAVGLGNRHGCLLGNSGVHCFGARGAGQQGVLGRRVATEHGDWDLFAIEALADVEELAVGESHNCVQQRNGRVLCWGDNSYGQVASELRDSIAARPVLVGEYPRDAQLSAHATLSCMSSTDGEHSCWGSCEMLPPLPKVRCAQRAHALPEEPPPR